MGCFCIDIDISNTYNNIMNKNPCYKCDEHYNFIYFLKITNQQSYNRLFEKLYRYNTIQKIVNELIYKNYKIWRIVYSSRKTLEIKRNLWNYDIPDCWNDNKRTY